MKPDKIHVEKPATEEDKKNKKKKDALINKDTVTIKENQEPAQIGNISDTP